MDENFLCTSVERTCAYTPNVRTASPELAPGVRSSSGYVAAVKQHEQSAISASKQADSLLCEATSGFMYLFWFRVNAAKIYASHVLIKAAWTPRQSSWQHRVTATSLSGQWSPAAIAWCLQRVAGRTVSGGHPGLQAIAFGPRRCDGRSPHVCRRCQ